MNRNAERCSLALLEGLLRMRTPSNMSCNISWSYPLTNLSLGLTGMFLNCAWSWPAYSSSTFTPDRPEGPKQTACFHVDLQQSSVAAQLSQVCAWGQIHRVQPPRPLIKLLKGATAFIKSIDITYCATVSPPFASSIFPSPCCNEGKQLNGGHLVCKPLLTLLWSFLCHFYVH